MNKKNKILLFLLILILTIDIVLLRFVYRQKIYATFTSIKNNIPLIKKDFVLYGNYEYTTLNGGILKVIDGDIEIPTYTTAIFKARVAGSPFLHKKSGYTILPITIDAKKKHINVNLILSTIDTQNLLIHTAKRGIIKDNVNLEAYKVKDTLSLFKKGYPLIVEVYFQKEIVNFIKNLGYCDDFCKYKMKELSGLSIQTELFFNKITNNQSTEDNIYIGPTQSLIIYVEK